MRKGRLHCTTQKTPVACPDGGTWKEKTWGGMERFSGYHVWSDGKNIYYSNEDYQYVLRGDTWEVKTWNVHIRFGEYVWTDGKSIYYSYGGGTHYVLKGDVWEEKAWNISFNARNVWTDGTNVYVSKGDEGNYVLNGDTWEPKAWNVGVFAIYGDNIWSDGTNIYSSSLSLQYVLNGDTWEKKTWSAGPYYIQGEDIWTDGTNIYYSSGDINLYILNGDAWEEYDTVASSGRCVWSDGRNIYYSNDSGQFVQERNIPEPAPTHWKTLFDGEVTTEEKDNGEGGAVVHVAILCDGSEYPLDLGTTFRLTIDGESTVLERRNEGADAEIGNPWLATYPVITQADKDSLDDGYEFAVISAVLLYGYENGPRAARLIARNPGPYTVKLEVLVAETSPIDHASFLQGWLVGRRLAGMRK